MRIITKDNKIVEGEPISDGLAKLVTDITYGDIGFTINYQHQREAFIAYMLANYSLTIKNKDNTDLDTSVEDHILPEVVE